MDDKDILNVIKQLVEEEQGLRETTPDEALTPDERARLYSLEIGLDQCWDLLRQRRAKREFGLDPNDATVRDSTTVERFLQ
jgi:hypothetical protein